MSIAVTNRRRWLSFLTKAVMAVIGLCLAVPALGYLCAPLRRKQPGEEGGAPLVDAGELADLPVGQWRLLTLEMVHEDGWEQTRVRRAVWVQRHDEDNHAVTVLSPLCPHLGCPTNWHPDQWQFKCPCHGGVFNEAGQVVAGPPPRPLDPLDFEVRAGRLWVRWQDFKIGIRERVPVLM
jgi:menaquinol-cytochrome c reductase iron-sulfur subunit